MIAFSGEVLKLRKQIGECLIQAGIISADDLRSAIAEHKRTGERLGVVLVRMNLVTETELARTLAMQLGFPYVDLSETPPEQAAVVRIPKAVALRRACIAVKLEQNLLTVAMFEPLVFGLVQDLEFQTGCRIKQVVATRADILGAIQTCYPGKALAQRTKKELIVTPALPPIDDLVDLVLKNAIQGKATDVHIEPREKSVLVRHRLDGVLKTVMNLSRATHEDLIARLKAKAGMETSERRLPQDGWLRAPAGDDMAVDFRVSTLHTLFGEKVVLRVLDRRKGVPALEEIGMSSTALEEVRRFVRYQHGMILVAGPPGSGRSTTVSSLLTSVKLEKANIVAIEDRIEYEIAGVNQIEIDEHINLTSTSVLRSILRQDPDVILISELRDAETAAVAVEAARTGQLVLSTLHANNATAVVTRLTDVGAHPSDIASALIGVVAQRLVRRLCVHCRRPCVPPVETLRALNISEAETTVIPFYTSVGCDQCSHTGYRGRIGLFEVMSVTERLQRLIAARIPEDQIREAALDAGMISLAEDGLAKVKKGVTTAEELLRVITELGEIRTLCTRCGSVVGVDFNACPACGARLGGACPHCGRALQPGWNFCPYCARSVVSELKGIRRVREGGGREAPRARPGTNVAKFRK